MKGDTFTAKNFPLGKGPKKIALLGNVAKPEPAQHIIEFPGGAIEVTRLSDGSGYWAHILVNRGWADPDMNGRVSAYGQVEASRLQTPDGLTEIPNARAVTQIAVLIRNSQSTINPAQTDSSEAA